MFSKTGSGKKKVVPIFVFTTLKLRVQIKCEDDYDIFRDETKRTLEHLDYQKLKGELTRSALHGSGQAHRLQ